MVDGLSADGAERRLASRLEVLCALEAAAHVTRLAVDQRCVLLPLHADYAQPLGQLSLRLRLSHHLNLRLHTAERTLHFRLERLERNQPQST